MKEFFERLNRIGRPARPDLTEKDYRLHVLLGGIARDDFLRDGLLFKGGTCLLKAYLGYYRFSEDLDFTWGDPAVRDLSSRSAAARRCSGLIDEISVRLVRLAGGCGLGFSGRKRDPREVRIGSGGRMATFFLRYPSEMLGGEGVLKVEVNFIEKLLFGPGTRRLRTYVEAVDAGELRFLYRDLWNGYSAAVDFPCYDLREIFVEKARAAITRRGFNTRDLMDLHFIQRGAGLSLGRYRKAIIEKTGFALDLYRRYRENIRLERVPSDAGLAAGAEKLLLGPVPEDLSREMGKIQRRLDRIRDDISAGR